MPKREIAQHRYITPGLLKGALVAIVRRGKAWTLQFFHVNFAHSMRCEDACRHDCLSSCPATDFAFLRVCVCARVRVFLQVPARC